MTAAVPSCYIACSVTETPSPRTQAGPARTIGLARAIGGAVLVWALDAGLLALALGGLDLLRAHPRALALLAVWGVGGLVLSVASPVRDHRPVASRGESPVVLLALLLLPLLTPPVAALGERLNLLPWLAIPAVEWSGVALAALGFALRLAAMLQLGSRFSPLVVVQEGHRLETRGAYARVRHPGYLGAWLACAGSALAFGSALAWPLVAAFAMVLLARIRREESLLEGHFGDAWRAYRARSGALLPRL
jgi:protein-S-isoprenylcysteine O-methyltransferase Ste14